MLNIRVKGLSKVESYGSNSSGLSMVYRKE